MEDRNVLERILAGSEQPRDLPLSLLETITDGFSKERKIGQGGFAEIYKVIFLFLYRLIVSYILAHIKVLS
jgi:hypothetical protein